MRKRENDMKIRCVNDFRASLVHPDLFFDSLAVAVNIFRLFVKDVCKIVQISADISRVRSHCMSGKTTKGDHLPKSR